jgi:hypothetical protein
MYRVTDMGGFPESGIVPRVNLAGGVTSFPGMSWYNTQFKKPHPSMFNTVINTFTSVADAADRMVVSMPAAATGGASYLRALLMPVIGAPYTCDAFICHDGAPTGTGSMVAGIIVSDGTKYESFYPGASNNLLRLFADTYTTTSSVGSVNILNITFGGNMAMYGLRMADDGTNRTFQISSNGRDWSTVLSRASAVFLTATQIGLSFLCTLNSTKYSIYHFDLRSGVAGDTP